MDNPEFSAASEKDRTMDVTNVLRPATRSAELEELLRANRGPIRWEKGVEVEEPIVARSGDYAHRVELHEVVFKERVDLRDITFRRTVDLRGCEFHKGLLLEGACFRGSLLMQNVKIGTDVQDPGNRAARFRALRVRGDVMAHGLLAESEVDLTGASVCGKLEIWSIHNGHEARIDGALRMTGAYVGGDVRLDGVQLRAGLDAEGVRVRGRLYLGPLREQNQMDSGAVLRPSSLGGGVKLNVARITGELNLVAAHIGGGVELQTAEIRGGVFCRCKHGHRPVVEQVFSAMGARIEGTFDCSGAELHSLVLQGATIGGAVFLVDGWDVPEGGPPGTEDVPDRPDLRTIVHGQVAFPQASIQGSVDLTKAQLYRWVDFDTAVITGFLDLDGTRIEGVLNLRSATIRGGVRCRCAGSTRPRVSGDVIGRAVVIGSELQVEGATFEGDVDFKGALISGPARFRGELGGADVGNGGPVGADRTRINGVLDLSDAVIVGAFDADRVQIGGELRLARTEVRGWADLRGARIMEAPTGEGAVAPPSATAVRAVSLRVGDSLRLGGAHLHGHLDLRHARVDGGLLAGTLLPDGDDHGSGPRIEGSLQLDAAEVTGTADFRGATITQELSLERSEIHGKLRFRLVPPTTGDVVTQIGSLDLRNARVHDLDFDGSYPLSTSALAKVPVSLEGCVFQELSVPGEDYAGLLVGDGGPFRMNSHVAMERWLRNRGNDAAAERVHDGMRQHRRTTLKGRIRRGADSVGGAARKLALQFHWLFLVSVLGYFITAAVFASPRSVVAKEPTAITATADASTLAKGAQSRVPTRWGWSDGFLFAAQVHLPMLTLSSRERWQPARRSIRAPLISLRFDAYATIISLLSYVVVPLIIGGVATTWLQRKGQS